ncbi:MAG: hypothetical protein GX558_02135 [Clostridiales bacterium]|nr:hypothetical protein [Clostridiales bacterium]
MNYTNQPVYHERFGCGVIRRCTGVTVEVAFPEYGVRNFIYPDAFVKFLRAEDSAFAQIVVADLDRARNEQTRRLAARVAEALVIPESPPDKPKRSARPRTAKSPGAKKKA